MARFTVRVELHRGTWEDYVLLHQLMASRGMHDVIADTDGTKYKLPPAEYNYVGDATRDQVLESARSAAVNVATSYAVLVTEAVGRSWHGLQQVAAKGYA